MFRGSTTVQTTQQLNVLKTRDDAIGMERKHVGANVYEERRYTRM